MKCPACGESELRPVELDQGLPAKECGKCGGRWLGSTEYWAWIEKAGTNQPERPADGGVPQISDSKHIKICPTCGHLLIRFRVGHGTGFSLDHCGTCNGVWLDRNEWETLKVRNLHDDIHRIFTAEWQGAIHAEARRTALERIYRQNFGDADFAEVQKIRAWIDAHPKRRALLAYLTDPKPLK